METHQKKKTTQNKSNHGDGNRTSNDVNKMQECIFKNKFFRLNQPLILVICIEKQWMKSILLFSRQSGASSIRKEKIPNEWMKSSFNHFSQDLDKPDNH